MNEKRKVYIVNKGFHDFTPAKRYGKLVYLTERPVNPFSITTHMRTFIDLLKNSTEDDLLIASGMSTLVAMAAMILVAKHGKVNFLIYKTEIDGYFKRTIQMKDEIRKWNR